MKLPKRVIGLVPVFLLLAGCASTARYGDFVRPVDAGSLRTFEVREAFTTGFNWLEADALVVARLSSEVLEERLAGKGYALPGGGEQADFFVVPKWRKYAGHRGSIFNPVDPAQGRLEKGRSGGSFGVRYGLVLEIYESSTGELFWRADLRDVFEAIRFSEHRVTLSLERAVQDFPVAQ